MTTAPPAVKPDLDAGFTLVEMIVALALFALISVAGLAMLGAVVTAHERTQGQLADITRLQRALFLVASDFDQATGRLGVKDGELTLSRTAAGAPPIQVRYRLTGQVFERRVGPGEAAAPQALVRGVSGVTWRFLGADGVWQGQWPAGAPPVDPRRAVELTITWADDPKAPPRLVRRILRLPAS